MRLSSWKEKFTGAFLHPAFHPRATNSFTPCSKTWVWFPDYLSGCFMVAVISWQYPYAGAGGLGFYLPDIVAIVQCDGLGKVMAIHMELPKWNPTLDDWENVPTSLVKLSLSAHSFCAIVFSFFLSFPFFCSWLSLSLSLHWALFEVCSRPVKGPPRPSRGSINDS